MLSYIEKREGAAKGTLYSREETELATAVEMVHTIHQNLCIEPVKFLDEVYIVEPYVYSWLSTAAAYDAKNIEGLALLYHKCPAPDLSIFLKIDPNVAFDRIKNRDSSDISILKSGLRHLELFDYGFSRTKSMLLYEPVQFDTGVISEKELHARLNPILLDVAIKKNLIIK